jgi:hypothetical protein
MTTTSPSATYWPPREGETWRVRPGGDPGACLMVKVAVGNGHAARAPLYVAPGTPLLCAGGIVGEAGPAIGWTLSERQRADAERAVRNAGARHTFTELASELVVIGVPLESILEPVQPDVDEQRAVVDDRAALLTGVCGDCGRRYDPTTAQAVALHRLGIHVCPQCVIDDDREQRERRS